ncbi:hypothetical protein BMS3Bbin06_00967 [bacterium BMS3Bbin06]|nr:hypothetical protein BMS3Bbin06_00967 [bacterium BMS3Bbin06]HDH00966.1 hypothetical protein [Nitrospirota bacterium]HDO35476.1 hypothetical protein [Nitrospirota bacterium]
MRNLIQLCSDKIGISINHIGNLPETREVSHYLLNIPRFLDTEVGGKYFNAVEGSLSGLLGVPEETRIEQWSGIDFTDDEIEELIGFIEGLDEGFFTGTNREIWKLRLFYRPEEVVAFLISRGVTHELFYN